MNKKRRNYKNKNSSSAPVVTENNVAKKQIKKPSVTEYCYEHNVSVSNFSETIKFHITEVIKILFMQGIALTINSVLTKDQIILVCKNLEIKFINHESQKKNDSNKWDQYITESKHNNSETRAPIVTVMGHVDHGKTSFLDYIRKTNIINSEHGGITQHIGAHLIKFNNKNICFIDTPGHEAFSQMRARGANITDIVILLIAADDGIKPQTIEALQHAQNANVKIIIFINKMDKENANPAAIKTELMKYDVVIEEYGGEYLCVEGSVKKEQGIDDLLQAILFVAEMMDLKCDSKCNAYGTVLESCLDKGFGSVITLLIQNGSLNKGDYLIFPNTFGKIRNIRNDKLQPVNFAGPSTSVKVAGISLLPNAGDRFIVRKSEKECRVIFEELKKHNNTNFNFTNFFEAEQEAEQKNLNIILKTDVFGSLEAIKQMVNTIENDQVQVKIVSSSVGNINDSDLQLAKVTKAIIFTFNIKPNKNIIDLSESMGVKFYYNNTIYKLKDEVEALMKGLMIIHKKEKIIGEAIIIELWKHSKIGTIAGCRVTSGIIQRNAFARILRNGKIVYESKILSLKHFKNEVKEILVNNECGLTIDNFQDFKNNDIIQTYCFIDESE